MSARTDLTSILRSLQLIAEASLKLQEENIKFIWRNSSLYPTLAACTSKVNNSSRELPKNFASYRDVGKDYLERVCTVFQSFSAYRNLPGEGRLY